MAAPVGGTNTVTEKSANRSELGVAFFRLIGRALWPVLAAAVIWMFHVQLSNMMDALTKDLAKARNVKAGGLEFVITTSNPPAPQQDVADLIKSFNDDEIEFVLGTAGQGLETTCYDSLNERDLSKEGPLALLQQAKLLKYQMVLPDKSKGCVQEIQVEYTPEIIKVHEYYVQLVEYVVKLDNTQ